MLILEYTVHVYTTIDTKLRKYLICQISEYLLQTEIDFPKSIFSLWGERGGAKGVGKNRFYFLRV